MADILDIDGRDMPGRTASDADARVEAALAMLAGDGHHIDCPRSHARRVLDELVSGSVPTNRFLQRPVKFAFRERKALEALLHVLEAMRDDAPIPQRLMLRILYDAERTHLRTYGRPIFADTYLASPVGPTGTMASLLLRGDLCDFADPQAIEGALAHGGGPSWACPSPLRAPDRDLLSRSDAEVMDASVGLCRSRRLRASELTQRERAWDEAAAGGVMDWAQILDPGEDGYDGALEHLRMTAAYAHI